MGNASGLPRRDIVVVGASAGGVQALRLLLGWLPGDLLAAVFVVLHLPDSAKSRLDSVLSRTSTLPVGTAAEGDAVTAGRILVAPSGRHLLLRGPGVQVRQGPRENGVRPSVDVLFRSAALTYGPRVVSIVLTGLLDDGARGTREVIRQGGVALVQDPATAEYSSMPLRAIEAAPTAHVAELAMLADLLVRVVNDEREPRGFAVSQPSGSAADKAHSDAAVAAQLAVSADETPTGPVG